MPPRSSSAFCISPAVRAIATPLFAQLGVEIGALLSATRELGGHLFDVHARFDRPNQGADLPVELGDLGPRGRHARGLPGVRLTCWPGLRG